MPAFLLVIAGLAGAGGVIAGAAASHAGFDPVARGLLETASRFLIMHAAALIGLCALLSQARWDSAALRVAAGLIALGAVLFGGGLILHATAGLAAFAPVVPVGGTTLILGWIVLALAALARSSYRDR